MKKWTDDEVNEITQKLRSMVHAIKIPANLVDDAIQEGWMYLLEARQDSDSLRILDYDKVESRLKKWFRTELRWRKGTLA